MINCIYNIYTIHNPVTPETMPPFCSSSIFQYKSTQKIPYQITMTTTKNSIVLCPFQEQVTPSPLSFHPASIISKKSHLPEYILSTNLLFSLRSTATSHFDSLLPSRMYVDDRTTLPQETTVSLQQPSCHVVSYLYFPWTTYLTLLTVKKTN